MEEKKNSGINERRTDRPGRVSLRKVVGKILGNSWFIERESK